MASSGANVIIWCYHVMLSSGMKCYHLGCNVIIWYKSLSTEANVIMVSSGAKVIIWCYHVMLSSGMITPPFFVFPGNFTHSLNTRIYLITEGEKMCQSAPRTLSCGRPQPISRKITYSYRIFKIRVIWS